MEIIEVFKKIKILILKNLKLEQTKFIEKAEVSEEFPPLKGRFYISNDERGDYFLFRKCHYQYCLCNLFEGIGALAIDKISLEPVAGNPHWNIPWHSTFYIVAEHIAAYLCMSEITRTKSTKGFIWLWFCWHLEERAYLNKFYLLFYEFFIVI